MTDCFHFSQNVIMRLLLVVLLLLLLQFVLLLQCSFIISVFRFLKNWCIIETISLWFGCEIEDITQIQL